MSAFHDSALIGASGSQGSYQISRSVRLRRSASGYFNRTPASASNRKTWTWSGWVKRGEFSATAGIQVLFDSRSGTSDNTVFGLAFGNGTFGTSADGLFVGQYNYFALVTTQVFRDPSAWYHIVLALDTTQATAANRMKLYVNGLQITTFNSTTYPALNADLAINLNQLHTLGSQSGSSNFNDCYLTDINFIDGQGLTPSSFGEFNALTGVWQPKKYSGSYGTNGFSINFSDNSAATAAAIGKDSSGNGNNWTPNNISVTAGVTYDSMIDTPTPYADGGNGRGNYAVVNPIGSSGISATIINGNLQVTTPGGNGAAYGSIAFPDSGNWYWEYTQTANASGAGCFSGISNYGTTQYVVYYGLNGEKYIDGINSAYGASYGNGDTIGVAVNVSSGQITFYKNNVSQGVISYTFSNKTLFSLFADGSGAPGTVTLNVNFGQRPFTYTPPTGFKALNTQNLPASTIENGRKFFDVTTYTGTGANNRVVANAGGMQPDLVWVKNRTNAYDHVLVDSVRGYASSLSSNSTQNEAFFGQLFDSATVNGTSYNGFYPGGFIVNGNFRVNNNTDAIVGWQWKAGGTAVTNTAGSISSQVSANVSAGFSVVTYTGTGANATVGHGLGVAAKMVIVKRRDIATNWRTWHASLTLGNTLYLDATNAQTSEPTAWNSTAPTSTVFSVGASGGTNTGTMVAYCFAEVAGYSKFGSYTGNGSTDGTFVYLGFRPRYVMVKASSIVADWLVYDTARDTYNVMNAELFPNTSGAEQTVSTNDFDFLSNGFKCRRGGTVSNQNGATYIYMAFAENPFSKALAR